MKIHIHRGQNQIGGSIIEISQDSTRIIFDIGVNLDNEINNEVPQIEGVFCGEKNCDAVFISHYHSDHIGLIDNVLTKIPIYMGEKAYKILESAFSYREKVIGFMPNFVYDRQPIQIGEIKITPYLCDHSSYDSYMFVIESEGMTILYTGDFRANGRMDFSQLLKNIPTVDVVIIEGTILSREEMKENIKEEKLEEIGVEYLTKHKGPAFILMSAMNIDRVITAQNIAKKTNRVFLEDIYTADIIRTITTEKQESNVRVFMTGGDKQYEKLKKYENIKIGKHEIAKTPFVMCIRQSMKNYLSKLNELMSFENGVLFYGIWKGYMENEEMHDFIEFMRSKGVKLHILHTSGHADEVTIDTLIKDINPKIIIPVHTENAEWFNKYSDKCDIILDKNLIEI